MALEIERKYLTCSEEYRAMAFGSRHIVQGYLSRRPEGTVRVRVSDASAWITIKGKTEGDTRMEFEYEVPLADAVRMLRLCDGRIIDKTRYLVDFEGYTWEVDEFHGAHDGLVVAEVELGHSGETPPLPPFIGVEVTGNPAYYNSNLSSQI